ncbi:MAG: thioredoxin family protein [Bacteroidetes bacterium]|nr:thioredoxin family protein [Bacteroidota bacterium]
MNLFDSVNKSYSYAEFMQLMELLVAEGKTTGPAQTESLIFYTKLNLQRMRRWEKTFQLQEVLANKVKIVKPQTWWLITEAWCGDSAQTLSGMQKMQESSLGNITLKIIMRDENLSIMDQYLTNGTRSIPILISVDKQGNELFHWGPRPAPAQKIIIDWKADHAGRSYEDIEKILHTWYAQDKGQTLQEEFLSILDV